MTKSKNILKIWLIQNVLEEVRQEVSKTKLERGIFDFDDLLRIVEEELLSNNKKKSVLNPLTLAVRKKYLCAFCYIINKKGVKKIYDSCFMNNNIKI